MTPQERDVIGGIFERMKSAQGAPRDPEAERFIAERIAAQPYAPYAMAQSVYVQEQALLNLQREVERLQAQIREMQSQPMQAPDQPGMQGGGFLGGLFGGRPQPQAPRSAVPSAGGGRPVGVPPGFAQQAPPQQGFGNQGPTPEQQPPGPWGGQRQGGGFLQTAMATAAGVAGGVVLGNVLMNAFSGGQKPDAAAAGGGTESAAAPADNAAPEAGAQQASYEDPGMDAGFGDGGFDGGGDWG
jgi:hypothetical protein